jgi:hypothetical protein
MDALVTGTFTVVGIVLGWLPARMVERRNARRRYREAVNACHHRLENIELASQAAREQPERAEELQEIVRSEIWHLGSAFDQYQAAKSDPDQREPADPAFEDRVRRVILLHEA